MKELFSKKAKKIITVLSLSCFLCSPVSYIFNMKQVAASSVNSNIVDEQYLDIIGFDKDDNWDRNYSDKRWKHRHHHHRHDDDDPTIGIGIHHDMIEMMMIKILIEGILQLQY